MNLTPHFTLSELTRSQYAERNDVDNRPQPDIARNLKLLAEVLEQVRALAGGPIIVSSGYRSPAVNKAIGGAKHSAHLTGLAADIHCPGLSPTALAHIIKSSQIKYDQLILEYPDGNGWVHIGIAETAPRFQLLTIKKGTGYMSGLV